MKTRNQMVRLSSHGALKLDVWKGQLAPAVWFGNYFWKLEKQINAHTRQSSHQTIFFFFLLWRFQSTGSSSDLPWLSRVVSIAGVFTSNNASKAEVYTILFAKTSKEEGALTCIMLTVGLVCFAERIGDKLGTFAVVNLVANLSYAKAFCICARANSRH